MRSTMFSLALGCVLAACQPGHHPPPEAPPPPGPYSPPDSQPPTPHDTKPLPVGLDLDGGR